MKFSDDVGVFCDESGTSLMSRCLVVGSSRKKKHGQRWTREV
jgi:hypothetical protein